MHTYIKLVEAELYEWHVHMYAKKRHAYVGKETHIHVKETTKHVKETYIHAKEGGMLVQAEQACIYMDVYIYVYI